MSMGMLPYTNFSLYNPGLINAIVMPYAIQMTMHVIREISAYSLAFWVLSRSRKIYSSPPTKKKLRNDTSWSGAYADIKVCIADGSSFMPNKDAMGVMSSIMVLIPAEQITMIAVR